METGTNDISPRDRILNTAADLFFHQGFRKTGVNEVIKQSDVAKATFYNHFSTKEDLCLAYLEDRSAREYAHIVSYVDNRTTPKDRFLAVIESIEPWLEGNSMRGCAFLNMAAEAPDPDHRLRHVGIHHYDMVQDLIRDLSCRLVESDEKQYAGLDAETLARDYMVILVGAIAMAEVYSGLFPVHQAINMVKRMIE